MSFVFVLLAVMIVLGGVLVVLTACRNEHRSRMQVKRQFAQMVEDAEAWLRETTGHH